MYSTHAHTHTQTPAHANCICIGIVLWFIFSGIAKLLLKYIFRVFEWECSYVT